MKTMTVQEAAEALSVSRQRVQKLLADGKLEAVPGVGLTYQVSTRSVNRRLRWLAAGSPQPRPPKGCLTVAQIARRLRTPERTVLSWIESGALPATREGRRWLVDRADLAKFRRPAIGRPRGVAS
jgi:excisionase family DNA binding protein